MHLPSQCVPSDPNGAAGLIGFRGRPSPFLCPCPPTTLCIRRFDSVNTVRPGRPISTVVFRSLPIKAASIDMSLKHNDSGLYDDLQYPDDDLSVDDNEPDSSDRYSNEKVLVYNFKSNRTSVMPKRELYRKAGQ